MAAFGSPPYTLPMEPNRSADAMDPAERALRDDVRFLGDRLGDTLALGEGRALYDLVEEIRALVKGAHRGDAAARARLVERLAGLEVERAAPLARAFAHFLALANIADNRHRARTWERAARQENAIAGAIRRCREAGRSSERIRAALLDQRIELVLTAHPTQAVRRTLLAKHARLAHALGLRETAEGEEERRLDEAVRREIASVWFTDEVRRRSPTPVDEARSGFALFEQVLWEAVPAFLRDVDAALQQETGAGLPVGASPIGFGNWMGGDRDGNANVTARITAEVCWLARWQAADLYHRDVGRLLDELSVAPATPALRELARTDAEPYRAVLHHLGQRLVATREFAAREAQAARAGQPPGVAGPDVLLDVAELRAPVEAMWASLVALDLEVLARGGLLDLLRRITVFGLTLAPLDVRQDSAVHAAAIDLVTRRLGLGSYLEWSEEQRMRYLEGELANPRPLLPRVRPEEPACRELHDTLAVIAHLPPGSLGAYVISMAHAPSDVLLVHLLQRELGVVSPLRVVPLFETLRDLEAAPSVVRVLLERPASRALWGDRMEIMIGYSDSAKDAGRVASSWALYRVQEQLLEVTRAAGIRLSLFHGRGGSVGRGGGPIALAIRSQPPGTVAGGVRVTVQGEVIDASFGLPAIARSTLELYVGSALEATLSPPPAPTDAFRARMEALAARSAEAYRAVLGDPRFVPYFRAATPEPELRFLNIGSRPARRAQGDGLGSLRAIPWIFAWTQMRLLLPSWLGVDAAFGEAVGLGDAPGGEAELAVMAREWPFFAALVDLLEMVLAKGDLATASLYDERLVPPALRPMGKELFESYDRARSAVLAIKGAETLLAQNEPLRWSFAVRNRYLDPLHVLQAELLRRLRAAEEADPRLVDAFVVTVNGIAAGLRNTG